MTYILHTFYSSKKIHKLGIHNLLAVSGNSYTQCIYWRKYTVHLYKNATNKPLKYQLGGSFPL